MVQIQQGLSQGQRLTQEQILAPQQLQSLEILMAPAMELEQKISEELMTNPVLEMEAPDEDHDPQSEQEPESDPDDEVHTDKESVPDSLYGNTPFDSPHFDQEESFDPNRDDFSETLDQMLTDSNHWDVLSEPESGETFRVSADSDSESEKRRQHLFDSVVKETSIQEELLEQLRFADAAPALHRAAEEVIGSLDEHGYLHTAEGEIAQSIPTDLATVDKAVRLVQSFDPPGIGARTPQECLLLQLERGGRGDTMLARLVRDHLEEISRNKLPQTAKALGISMEKLNELLAELRKLNPYPAVGLERGNPAFVVPDVTVLEDGEEYQIIENKERIPRLLISNRYLKMLEDPCVPDEAKSYIRQKVTSGKNLMRALEQRSSTIMRIARLIVSAQYDFLKHGPESLKPMTMQSIADKLGLHEATISRAISGKYMRTPRGIYEFKYFFSSGFRSEAGEEVSSHGIKEIIRDLVSEENTASPLSDSKLAELLKEKGFDVARRTVAKYREELGIQSSQMRKVFS